MNDTRLAINGGKPVRTALWHESNAIGKEEKKAVLRVMENGRLSCFLGTYNPAPPYNFLGGPEVQLLENQMKEKIGATHVVSMNSATSCLSAAIGALGIGFGDEVIVSPYTMSACAVAPIWYGAIPVFADVEHDTGCLDPDSIRKSLSSRTKAILVIHQFGFPANMDAIMAIAKEHHLVVIEDCAQAWGAMYKGKSVGTIGDIGVFSFNVHKTIQCGEGGLCVTANKELAFRLQMIRNHGESVVEDAHYENITNIVGCNFRMTEIQAAIAQEQLKKLDALNDMRLTLVEYLSKALSHHDCLITPLPPLERSATYYVYPLRFLGSKCKSLTRNRFVDLLHAEGIRFAKGYVKPLYLLPIFQTRTAFKHGYPWSAPENRSSLPTYTKGTCPVAERLYEDEMMINLFVCPPQTKKDIHDIALAIDKVLTAIFKKDLVTQPT